MKRFVKPLLVTIQPFVLFYTIMVAVRTTLDMDITKITIESLMSSEVMITMGWIILATIITVTVCLWYVRKGLHTASIIKDNASMLQKEREAFRTIMRNV